MSAKTFKFEAFGVSYRTTQFTAVPAMELLRRAGKIHPTEVLARTEAKDSDGDWVLLDNADAINRCVLDRADAIPSVTVLRGLLDIIHEKNFKFLEEWKGARMPRRFVDEAQTASTQNADPLIAQLIQDGSATMRELEEYYSLYDAFVMFDILVVKGLNQALSYEAATSKRRRV
ncbi:hypothetical protein PLUTO_00020 [Luteibacter phage vB_LflM-Pluto]|uniref:Uncharacterized protein n=1 Tax=Luteibacter phage vB_LflM-Pluto TaxID=2948611 RepID=A0A9E7MTN4_9CAUD|nr:hypothetical protein PLUTO_00020 [Luteibacter phage vB_LflM-Pluto]